jgi:hypothetical protein
VVKYSTYNKKQDDYLGGAGGPLDKGVEPDEQHPCPAGKVEDLNLALHVRLAGQELGENGELVVGPLHDHVDEHAQGHVTRLLLVLLHLSHHHPSWKKKNSQNEALQQKKTFENRALETEQLC